LFGSTRVATGLGLAAITRARLFVRRTVDQELADQIFQLHRRLGQDHLVTLGKHLHMRVVAEGVETRQQLAFLIAHNCPEGQGDYFSRPVAADELAVLLSRRFPVVQASAPVSHVPRPYADATERV